MQILWLKIILEEILGEIKNFKINEINEIFNSKVNMKMKEINSVQEILVKLLSNK